MIAFAFILALSLYLVVCRTAQPGSRWGFDALFGPIQGQTLTMHLFVNNFTPLWNSLYTDFTELSESGYSAINLNGGSWTLTNFSTYQDGDYPNVTFTWTTGGSSVTVYGYYVLDGSNNVMFSEVFSNGPYTFPATTPASLTITPGVRVQ